MVVWQARPTRGLVARAVIAWLVFAAAGVGFFQLGVLVARSNGHPGPFLGPSVLPLVALVVHTVGELRGRVRVEPDALEVRRLRTRRYPWLSLRSITLEEDGQIEITPNGWVRHLPIPASETPAAFATITEWSDRARATADQG